MLFIAFHALAFFIMVGEGLGCKHDGSCKYWENCYKKGCPCIDQGRRKREADDMEAVHLTFGECSNNEESCLNARYDSSNITDSIGAALIESLTLPIVDSMNCEELCNCLSCAHGHCSKQENHDKCYGNGSGFICECENSDSYPSFSSIVKDVLATGMACRQCEK